MGKGMENSFSNILPFSCPGQEAQYQKSSWPEPLPTLFPSGVRPFGRDVLFCYLSEVLFTNWAAQ